MDISQLFIHVSADGDLGCFQFLAVMNKAGVVTGVPVLYSQTLLFPLGRHLGVDLLGYMEEMFFFLRDCCAVPKGVLLETPGFCSDTWKSSEVLSSSFTLRKKVDRLKSVMLLRCTRERVVGQ